MSYANRPKHSDAFRRRRAQNWLTLGFTYTAMYMGRYNLSLANKSLSDAYGWTAVQIGAIITTALTIYGISAIFNGPIADKIGGRRSMIIGATGSVAFNLLFGFGAYLAASSTKSWLLTYFAIVWGMNCYFQSFSALSLIKVNSAWFHISERGVFSAIFGSMIQAGRLLILLLGGLLVTYLSWQWLFFVPAMLISAMALATFFIVRNAPEDVKLPALDVQDASSGDKGDVTFKYVLRKIFTNPVTLMIAFAEFCTGFVRHGFEQWFPRYMQEAQHLTLSSPIFQKGAGAVVFAGIVGAFTAGTLSDWVFKGRRTPMAAVGYGLQIICLLIVAYAPSLEWVIGAFVVNSFAISIVHSMLSGTASMDFGGKKAAATATGLFDGMQYIGGSFVGVGMGWLIQNWGWKAWAPSMVGFAAIGAIIMIILWNARPGKHA